MQISQIISNILDTINRPVDEVWSDRVEKFIVQSFNRLGQKLLYEPVDIAIEVITPTLNDLTSDGKALKVNVVKPFIQLIYSEKTKGFIERLNLEECTFEDLSVENVFNVGTTYYFNKALDGSKIYFFYTNQVKVDEETIKELSNIQFEIFENAYDFIYYDVLVRVYNLINENIDKVSMMKQLRDEAYVDLTSWVSALNDKGILSIKG